MDLLTRDSDMVPCPHCGHELRKGMIRCRECNGVVNEDFVLAHDVVALDAVDHRCAQCGMVLEPGVDDCPSCASAMLDQLLSTGPGAPSAVPPRFSANDRPASSSQSRLREYTPAPRTEEAPEPAVESGRGGSGKAGSKPADSKGKGKRRKGAAAARESDEEAGTDALYESDTDVRARQSGSTNPEIDRPTPAPAVDEVDAETGAIPEEAASAACRSLLTALATPDVDALCKVVVALGQLGDKSAINPLERLMINPEIRVRRSAAEALIALGHPKGKALYDIAERKIATPPPSANKSYSKPKKYREPTDWAAMKTPAIAVLALAIVGGGIWYWQAGPSGPKVPKKVSSAKKAAANRMKTAKKAGGAAAPAAGKGAAAFDN